MSHVIPAIIRKCVEAGKAGNDEVVLWGTGAPTRELLYVDDAAEGIVLALEHLEEPEPANLPLPTTHFYPSVYPPERRSV